MSYRQTSSLALIIRHTGDVFPLSQAPITIGRQEDNTIVLDDPQASRQHAIITWQAGTHIVQDRGSANGTYLNERRLTGPQPLRDGYVLRIGGTIFDVRLAAGREQDQTMVGAAAPGQSYTSGSRGSLAIPIIIGLLLAGIVVVGLAIAAILLFSGEGKSMPAVAIQSPPQDAEIIANSEIILQATAAGAPDITRLELKVDDILIAISTSPDSDGTGALTVSKAWAFGQIGPHVVSAVAYTSRDAKGTSSSINVTVVDTVSQITPTETVATPSPTVTPSATPSPSDLPPIMVSDTPSPTPTPTATPTATPTPTPTPTSTPTHTPTPTTLPPQYDLYVRRMDFSPNLIVGETIEMAVMIATDIYPATGPFFPASHFRWRQGPGFPWQEEVCPESAQYASCTKAIYFSYADPGDYYVEVEADSRNEVLETDKGNNNRGWTISVQPRNTTVTFEAFPDGTPISTDRILNGDEFLARGIRLAGAPASVSSCGGIATVPAIRRSQYGISGGFLTTARPDSTVHCNFGPVTIRFTTPARRVTLTFAGASETYTMEGYDSADGFLGAAYQNAVAYGGTFDVTLSSTMANISRVTLGGPPGALTAITQIYYEW